MSEVTKPMSEEELLECLRKFCLNASITIDDIKFPKPPFIISVFQSFLSALQINVDFIYTPPFKISDTIENNEWYEEVLPLSSLKILMSYMMQFSGISDLGIGDILEPKPKRTKKILNYLITLWKTYLIKDNMHDELGEKYQAEIERKQELLNEIELTEQRLNDTLASIEKKKEVFFLRKENQAKFELVTISKDAIADNYQKLKSKEADYLKKLREFDVQIESQKVHLEELDQKILKSPNRLDAEKEQLRQKILEVDNKTKEIQSKSVTQKKLIDDLNSACELLMKSGENMKSICCLSEQLREAAASVDLSVARNKEEEENVKRIHFELEKEEELKFLNEQLLAKENLNARKKIAALKEIVGINKQAIEKVESDCERNQNTVDELKELLKNSEQAIAIEKEKHEAYVNKVAEEYGVLKKCFVDYTVRLGKTLDLGVQESVDPDLLAKIKKIAGLQQKS